MTEPTFASSLYLIVKAIVWIVVSFLVFTMLLTVVAVAFHYDDLKASQEKPALESDK